MNKDRPAYEKSIVQLMAWDFDRVVMSHGDVIETGAKARLAAVFKDHALI